MEKIVLIFRKPESSMKSIEFLFHTIFEGLKNKLDIVEYQLPYFSSGLLKRLGNVFSMLPFRNRIIHITGDSYYAILGVFFCKRVITIHDLSFLTRTKGIKNKILKLFWVTLPCKHSHKIIVVSESTRQAVLNEISIAPEKIQVIYNFIDAVYKPIERKFNNTFPKILQIGTDFNKNIEMLGKALQGIPCLLTIIGNLKSDQKRILSSLSINYINKINLSQEEMHQEFLQADILSFVSTVEGFGLPILEAHATGLPVVTSNCSSMPEVAGGAAIFVDPNNITSIRNGILILINDKNKRSQLVNAGYENIKRFSKEKVIDDYLNFYKTL